jgi:hypothetical protein
MPYNRLEVNVTKTQGLVRHYAIVLLTLMSLSHCIAQNAEQTPHRQETASIYSLWPTWPKARPEDVQSVQSVIRTYFEILSGSAATERDWDRFRSLFLPDGRFVAVRTWNNDPHLIPDALDMQKMIERFKTNLHKADSEERPLEIQVKNASDLVQALVTSEIQIHTTANGDLLAHRVYSFELVKDADRYWIVEILSE